MTPADQCIKANLNRRRDEGMLVKRAKAATAEACGVTVLRVRQAMGWTWRSNR